MYPYKLLVAVTKKKKRKIVLGGKCDTIVDNYYCILNKVSFNSSNKWLPCTK